MRPPALALALWRSLRGPPALALWSRSSGCTLLRSSCCARRLATAPPRSGTEAVPFALSPPDVFTRLQAWWAQSCPGLNVPKWGLPKPLFLPFWAFQLDLRIASANVTRHAFFGPSTLLYAGARFPRTSVEVVKCDLHQALPFRASMLQRDGEEELAGVEPFELYESTAWALVRASFLAHEAGLQPSSGAGGSAPSFGHDAVFTNVRSHRLLLPVFVVSYPFFFEQFNVFVNGATGEVAGVQQFSPMAALSRLLAVDTLKLERLIKIIARVLYAGQKELPPQTLLAIVNAALLFARPLLKVLLWPPLFLASAATFGAFSLHAFSRGHRAQRAELAAWEEQRAAERAIQAAMSDEWRFRPQGPPSGARERDAERAREEATEAAAAAAAAAAEAARTRQQQQQQQQRQRQQATERDARGAAPRAYAHRQPERPRRPLPPPVDASDYYAVLALTPAASDDDVKAAFRSQLMKWHPDHQGEFGFDEAACSERTRAIITAYGTLRDKYRRRTYDSSYRANSRRR